MRRLTAGLTALGMAGALATGAAADPAPARPPTSDWTVMLGVEGRVMPSYEGSSSFMLRPFPMFDVRRAGTPAGFRSPRDGFGIGLLDSSRFQVGPAAKLQFPRPEGSSANLRGLGDIGWAFEAGAFVEYSPAEWLRTRVELRQGFGGHHGLVSDVSADLVVPVTNQLTLSGGPRVTLSTAAAASPYFSITPAQSAASGLPVYNAGGGVRAFGAGAQARYEWSKAWATHVFFEYDRLAGDAANAPLVTRYGSRDQIQVGTGLSYSFDMKALW